MWYLLGCDVCGSFYRKRSCQQPQRKVRHYCSVKCTGVDRRVGGTLYRSQQQVSLQKWGVQHPSQSYDVRARTKRTNVRKYGVSCTLWAPTVHERVLQTWQANYGVDHPSRSSGVQARARATLQETHGVSNAFQIPNVREKAKMGAVSEAAERKRQATNEARYGHPFIMQNAEMLQKSARSARKAYVLQHWQTGDELTCVGAYEVAFVNWCNHFSIDFDWQVTLKTELLTPTGRKAVYVIDAFIKTGEFAGKWIEVKGRLDGRTGEKWFCFHEANPNTSQLWDRQRLLELGILVRGRGNPVPNPLYELKTSGSKLTVNA